MKNWVYSISEDHKCRYILGKKGENPLICMGINPGGSTPEKLSKTARRIEYYSKKLGFDGYMIVNIYPQCSVNPHGLDLVADNEKCDENKKFIEEFLKDGSYTIWAAWGSKIELRDYLIACLDDIYRLTEAEEKKHSWISLGKRSKSGHPHHPLYLANEAPAESFDVPAYIKKLCEKGTAESK